MTRNPGFLCAVIIGLMLTAGCTFSPASVPPPLMSPTTATTGTPLPSTAVPAATIQPQAAGTQVPGTCTADTRSDAANCGGCGYVCPANALCQSGQCYCMAGFTVENNLCVLAPAGTSAATPCPAGMSPCPDGYCYELASSPANCGTCGNVCPSGMLCSASTCTNAATAATTAPTTTVTTGTTTVITTSSVGTGLTLVKPGGYTLSCAVFGMTNCGGSCVNLSSSNGNCGSCGTICSGLTATCCGGTCTSLKTDIANCGSCGHACKGFLPSCESGTCKSKAVVRTTIPVKVIPSIKVMEPGIPLPVGPQI